MVDEKDLKKYGNPEESKTQVRRYPDYKADDWRKQADEYQKDRQKTAPPGGQGHPVLDLLGYAKGGQVGRVGKFGLKRSKPDFASGGGIQNFKKWSK